jgi:hypothetical protein
LACGQTGCSPYTYDDLYRLTGATGRWQTQPNKSESFTLSMGYDTIHNIAAKTQRHVATQPGGVDIVQRKTSYNWTYAHDAAQPHAPSLIFGTRLRSA